MTAALSEAEKPRLDALMAVHAGRSECTRLKDTLRRATLKHLRQGTERLTRLEAILTPQSFLRAMPHTKLQQVAAEAAALDVGDIRAILYGPRRWSLLLCCLHPAQVQTRDQWVAMVLKRVRPITNAAKERRKERPEHHRELAEPLLAVFSEVLAHTLDTPEDEEATLGHRVRQLLQTRGGAETLRDQYEQVAASHSDNSRPLRWGLYRPYRAELFRLSHLLTFHSAIHDPSLLDALRFIQPFQHARGDYGPAAIALDFASVRWQVLLKIRHQMTPRLHRRPLEVCVFPYLDHGLRRGDVYVEGSEASADSRQQLLPWDACVPRLPAYCQALQCAPTATEFVAALRERLREVAQRVAAAYPANTALTMDEDGTPPRKRLPAQPVPDGLPTLAALLTARLPERHLLAILKHVHYWVGYPRHFGPLSGTERTLSSPVLRYLFTVFGYAGELGASQTARHTTGPLRRQRLRRLHAQHMTTPKLEAAGRDGIAAYTRFELPFLWGSGHAAMAEGTPIALLENTLLGAQHVRYGRFGGIASHHIRDTSIALFSRVVP